MEEEGKTRMRRRKERVYEKVISVILKSTIIESHSTEPVGKVKHCNRY